MKKQKVVRTYNRFRDRQLGYLREYLDEGYTVVMANSYIDTDGSTDCIEYILEKEISS